MKKLVYVSHPSGGLEENKKEVEEIMSELHKHDEIISRYCFVSPIHNYGYMYNDVDYRRGLDFCIDLLENCSLMLLCGKWTESRGCRAEVQTCRDEQIGVIEIDTVATLKEMLASGRLLKELDGR